MTLIKTAFIELVSNLRSIKKDPITFIQLGSYLGDSPLNRDDFANEVLEYTDVGIFVEPNPISFSQLIENNKKYINAKFLNKAVIPSYLDYHEYFHITPLGGGSTFIKGAQYGEKSVEDYKPIKVSVITVEQLIVGYVDFPVDLFISDCEGYDHGIIIKLLDYIQPKIMIFESWDMNSINQSVERNGYKFNTRDEVLEKCNKLGYKIQLPEWKYDDVLCYKY